MKEKSAFDGVAAEWDKNSTRKEVTIAVAKEIRDMCVIRPEMSVLEYGCGTGNLSIMLASDVRDIVAVDSSAGMIAELEKKLANSANSNIRPVLLDLEKEDSLNDKFDLIITAMTLHHIDNIEMVSAKFAQMLIPGGRIFIADLCSEDGSFHSDMKVPHNGFDPEKLVDLMTSTGLKNSRWKTIHTIEKNDSAYHVFGLVGIKKK